MAHIDDIKIMLGIFDDKQDEILNTVVRLTTQRLLSKLPKTETTVPERLEYIITEVAIKRFNRIGAEGMSSESVDGRSNTFKDDDFDEYLKDIEEYYAVKKDSRGKVTFFY
ncbi:phage head-tail adapter protein [Staphylococcus felis]|uniref:Phage head-tail connector protein n=1 Tax=Staphylococcus felis TaxID=46127 RepID=A0ABS0QNQ1_9STAP|nr:phage head-tail connector protein [Staphylococcus felis]MBH9580883.1 phage head-tail connector protein [Staphylococcus felis]REI04065.1 phage head-tail adapter protein [Staphylococcus felis]